MAVTLVSVSRTRVRRGPALALPPEVFDGPQAVLRERNGKVAIEVAGRLICLDRMDVTPWARRKV
jgi:hypothetical protein